LRLLERKKVGKDTPLVVERGRYNCCRIAVLYLYHIDDSRLMNNNRMLTMRFI